MKFNSLVCLGKNCQTRWHLQRYCENKQGRDTSQAHVFDWSWHRGDMTGIINWLRAKLDFRLEDLTIEKVGTKYELVLQPYGLYYPHEINFSDPESLEACTKELGEQLSTVHSKFLHLTNKTVRALETESLAVLTWGDVRIEEIDDLVDVLATYGARNATVIVFRPSCSKGAPPYHPRSIVLDVIEEEWPGHASSWANAFKALNLDI